jgi:hypothetical protein
MTLAILFIQIKITILMSMGSRLLCLTKMENWHPWKMWLNVMVEIYNFHHTTSILILWFVMALRKLYGGQNGLPLNILIFYLE